MSIEKLIRSYLSDNFAQFIQKCSELISGNYVFRFLIIPERILQLKGFLQLFDSS